MVNVETVGSIESAPGATSADGASGQAGARSVEGEPWGSSSSGLRSTERFAWSCLRSRPRARNSRVTAAVTTLPESAACGSRNKDGVLTLDLAIALGEMPFFSYPVD